MYLLYLKTATSYEIAVFIVLCLYLDSKLSAAFNTASLDHCAASFGRNASAKAVCAGAVTSVWLVCSLWHICTILAFIIYLYKRKYLLEPPSRYVVCKTFPHYP